MARPPLTIRPFRRSDLPTLARIDEACFPPGISYSRHELEAFIRHSSSRTWVAESGEEILGFLIAMREPAESRLGLLPAASKRTGVGHIITIDVVESRRREGAGTALMNAVDDWARRERLALIYLETAEDNFAAQTFYARLGYAKMDEVPRYYSNGATAWIMVKWLFGAAYGYGLGHQAKTGD